MSYSITYTSAAQHQLKKLPGRARRSISDALSRLASNPHGASGVLKMSNGSGYRLRVGSYRVIYTVDNRQLVITVVRAADRREAY